jgi:hypothetical protein
MKQAVSGRVRFGDFEFDLKSGELCSPSDPVARILLREQPFQVLRMPIQRPGQQQGMLEIGSSSENTFND